MTEQAQRLKKMKIDTVIENMFKNKDIKALKKVFNVK